MAPTLLQTSSSAACTSCTTDDQLEFPTEIVKPVSTPTKHASPSITVEDVIPFHHVATIIVLISIALLVILSLIGWLSYRKKESFCCLCCSSGTEEEASSARFGGKRDGPFVSATKKGEQGDTSLESEASSITELSTPQQKFVSIAVLPALDDQPSKLEVIDDPALMRYSSYQQELAAFQPAGRLDTVYEELCEYDIVPYLMDSDNSNLRWASSRLSMKVAPGSSGALP